MRPLPVFDLSRLDVSPLFEKEDKWSHKEWRSLTKRPFEPARTLVNMVLLLAFKDRASEVKFEPLEENRYRLTYVVDGKRQVLVPPPGGLKDVIAALFRDLVCPSPFRQFLADCMRRGASRLDLREAGAFGGRFAVELGAHRTEIQATFQDTPHGCAITLKIDPIPGPGRSRTAHEVLKACMKARSGEAIKEDEPPATGARAIPEVPALFPAPGETCAGVVADLWNRRRSCQDVLEACLTRIDEWEPKVRAWAYLDREGARAQARALDEEIAADLWRGWLHGVPVGIKDIIDVAGLPTGNGSPLGPGRIAEADAPLVARLRKAGAILVGKTVTTPYAWIDPPPTHNPWNLERTPGGSSSGSAAALACGMALGALGSQTGGSIVRPAAYCGVVGLKPTYGHLPDQGILPLAPSLDHPGLLARTATDLRRLWHILIRPDTIDQHRDSDSDDADPIPIKLGRLRGPFEDRAEPVMRKALDRELERLRASGIEVVEAPLPFDFDRVLSSHRTILAAEAAVYHAPRMAEQPDAYPPQIRALVEEGLALPASAYIGARTHLKDVRASCQGWVSEGISALVTPATPGPAPDLTTTGPPLFNSPWSFAGLPIVTLPIGLSPDGLPLGMQLIGQANDEDGLLYVAQRCELVGHGADRA